MSRLSASLVLGAALAGCGGTNELRSPGCDEGKPVVATGTLTALFPQYANGPESVSLALSTSVNPRVVAVAALEDPDFPLPFTLCTDLPADGSQTRVDLSATIQLSDNGRTGFAGAQLTYQGQALQDLTLQVRDWFHSDIGVPLDPCDGSGC